MSGGLAFFAVCFPSLFSIIDPISAVPIYLALAGAAPRPHQRRIAVRAALTLTIVLGVFATMGTMIFKFFGITIAAFKVAGGILLFTMALEMLRARHSDVKSTPEETTAAKHQEDVAIVPLGIPILSGPGAIATAMMWSSRAHHFDEQTALVAAIVLVAAITLLTLLFASRLSQLLGTTGINLVTRIMGLILAASAAQFVLDGWREAMA
jgi:multiple antibiotic resistance protein